MTQRSGTALGLAVAGLMVLSAAPAMADDVLLGQFSIGSAATDINGFRLKEGDGAGGWVLGARVTDDFGGDNGRATFDLGRPEGGMRLSLGIQVDRDDNAAVFGPVDRNQPFSFGSEQSSQATPYVGLGYVGRISDRFEITIDAGAAYLGSDAESAFDQQLDIDREGSIFGWSPTVTLSGRVRF